MDDPALSKSYDAQMLQADIDNSWLRHKEVESPQSYDIQMLQNAIDDFDSTGCTVKMNKYITGFIMNQMTATKGIKKHGELAVTDLLADFQQVHDMSVFEGMDPTLLTKEQKHSALRAINLIKEKRNGVLKGRTVADGRPERELYTDEIRRRPLFPLMH